MPWGRGEGRKGDLFLPAINPSLDNASVLPTSLSCNQDHLTKPTDALPALSATTAAEAGRKIPPSPTANQRPGAYTDVRILQPSSLGSFEKPDPGGLHEPGGVFLIRSCSSAGR